MDEFERIVNGIDDGKEARFNGFMFLCDEMELGMRSNPASRVIVERLVHTMIHRLFEVLIDGCEDCAAS